MIQNFFEKQYPSEGVGKDKQQTMFEIIERISRLYYLTANPMEKGVVRNCIEVMKIANIPQQAKTILNAVASTFKNEFVE